MGFQQLLPNNNKEGDPLRKVANAKVMNFLANFVNDLQGINCRVEKPDDDGYGCRIVIGDGSDIEPEEESGAASPYTPLVYEATADESSGTITAKPLNLNGTLVGTDQTFNVLPD